MKSWRGDPYLWVHLAGLATVPLWIDLCLLGLAVGTPTLPRLELGFILVLGVLPALIMQLRRPFYIFSLPGLALRPAALHDEQRRLLTQFRRWRVRLGALLVPLPLVWVLAKLYPLAFLARDVTPFGDWGRLGGLAIAALGFCLANLFCQVPVAVLQVLATPEHRMQTVTPHPAEQIATDFTWLGFTIGQILSDLTGFDSDSLETDSLDPKSLGTHSLASPTTELLTENLGDIDIGGETLEPSPGLDVLQPGQATAAELENVEATVHTAHVEDHEVIDRLGADTAAMHQGLDTQEVDLSPLRPEPSTLLHPEVDDVALDQELTDHDNLTSWALQPVDAFANDS